MSSHTPALLHPRYPGHGQLYAGLDLDNMQPLSEHREGFNLELLPHRTGTMIPEVALFFHAKPLCIAPHVNRAISYPTPARRTA